MRTFSNLVLLILHCLDWSLGLRLRSYFALIYLYILCYITLLQTFLYFSLALLSLLWDVLSKFGCPPQFLAVLRAFHDGMTAKVVMNGLESDPFMVNIGVKQDCVLAPVIFSLFLVAITLAFRHGVTMEDAVGINYCLDGNLFNVRRLQAKTKTNSEHVFELQYADDADLPSHSAEGLQRNLDNTSATYKSAGILVNVKKTEVMTQPPQRAHPVFSVNNVPPYRCRALHISGQCSVS